MSQPIAFSPLNGMPYPAPIGYPGTDTDGTTNLPDLVDAYAEAKAAEAAAAERAKDLRDQIMEQVEDREDRSLPITGRRYAVRVSTSKGHRLDSTRLKREQLPIWVAYSTETSSTRLTVIDRAQEQAGGAS